MCYTKKMCLVFMQRQGFSFEYALCFNLLIHIVCNSSSKASKALPVGRAMNFKTLARL